LCQRRKKTGKCYYSVLRKEEGKTAPGRKKINPHFPEKKICADKKGKGPSRGIFKSDDQRRGGEGVRRAGEGREGGGLLRRPTCREDSRMYWRRGLPFGSPKIIGRGRRRGNMTRRLSREEKKKRGGNGVVAGKGEETVTTLCLCSERATCRRF